ncbi:tRNA-splicing endonuclease [Diaporthe amygdali]|uniref:tRNA-splicing endonuclease n=1 Tax=Phomopsis amygdali TaxID=1214568 RepID=UPI0022FE698E|nr:tRNA-splicing endonuclease [Diaporthe amygdali]KAJ0123384.1 tRNA-splicing endonuclease [Diaporthe amygdali]
MDDTNRLYEGVTESYQEWINLPEEYHLLCPKTESDDSEDEYSAGTTEVTAEETERRTQEARRRVELTYDLSLLLGITEEQSSGWKEQWVERTESFLTKCDACVLRWHMHRKKFFEKLQGSFDEDVATIMENKLNEFDKSRIDRGLQKAAAILEANGPMTSAKLAHQDMNAIVALFEALCCMAYVGEPQTRQRYFNKVFQDVQTRKPLKLGEQVVPTMAFFLFEEDPYRNRFAKSAWEVLNPECLTEEEFDFAVSESLTNAIREVGAVDPESGTLRVSQNKVKVFWEGFLLLLNSMSEEIVVHCLRGMEADVYQLAIHHLQFCHSDQILLLVLQAIAALLQKSPKAFWGALELPRAQLAQFVFMNPAFKQLLSRSLEYDRLVADGHTRVPFLAIWVRTVIGSLQQHELPDVCKSLTDHLFSAHPDLDASREAQVTRTIAGLYALKTSLDSFNGGTFQIRMGTSIIYINSLINLVVQYASSVINPAAELRPEDRFNVGLSQTAVDVIKTSLVLDSKTTRTEWMTLMRGNVKIPRTNPRHSAQLWDRFLEIFWPGRPGTVDIAKSMLYAMHPLNGIGKLLPPKKEVLKDPEKKLFNQDLDQTAEAVGRMMERLSGFAFADLEALCSDQQSGMMYAIVASLVHTEDPIREAGISLIKTITSETTRSDAVAQMAQDYFQPFLSTFSDVVRGVTYDKDSMKPFPPMPHVLTCSRDLVGALCDTSGLLRSRTLSGIEYTAVMSWWTTQWEGMQHAFLQLRVWNEQIDKAILEVFCRQTMELAQALLDQDGVVASALSAQNMGNEAMKVVLEQPRLNTGGITNMIKLRDIYLLDTTVRTLLKLLSRLAQEDGKYAINSNLTGTQKAELLKAIGEDEQIPTVSKVVEKPKKQISLDAWSKSGATTPLSRSGSTTPVSTSRDIKPSSSKLEKLRLSEKTKPKLLRPEPTKVSQSKFLEDRRRAQAEKAERKAAAIAEAKALRVVPGEGSGLRGVSGVIGKDHGPQPKSDMMVDSSEEDDESSDDDDLVTSKDGNKLDHDAKQRALQLAAKRMGPLKKEKVKRSAKDMRARIIPPMDVLHQSILEWDIFHEGNDPPNGDVCLEVANTYMTHHDYKSTFFPLLRNEAWRSFVTAKDETTSKPFGIKVMNRMTVDKFMEVTTSMPKAQNKERGLSEGDIVIISQSEDPLNQKDAAHCLARIWKMTYKKDNLEVAYRLSRNNKMPELQPGAQFTAVKITNMTTVEREYAALESLQYYDLLDEVLEAKPSPVLNYGDEAIDSVMKNYFLNRAQAKAIMNAKDNDGFTLVQGPPGTGKTKTIVAMVGALLTGHMSTRHAAAVPVTRPHELGNQANQPPPMKKLLVCAPSNAAVDELVLRLKQGVKTMNGAHHNISVLRLGRSDAINTLVKDVTLDELVKSKMESELNKNGPVGSERDKMHQEAGEIKMQLNDLRPRLEAARASSDRDAQSTLERQFDVLKRRQAQIGAKIDADKDSGNTYVRESEVRRRVVQQQILDSAQVLCATLSGSGHEMFKNLNVEFETVIIDEAAQCVELSALIPLKYGCTKCILVGDPKQLPPTVLSQSAARFGYDQSLFVRMQRNHPKDCHLLDTQYRMHPEISAYPSAQFYEGKLYDGIDMGSLRKQKWHESKLLGPYRFFDVEGVQERGRKGQSLVNTNELEVAMQLYTRFKVDYADCDVKGKVGIITPYKAQLFALRDRFANRFGEGIFDEVEFNTTDAFQGRECEIIIFSCVRASPTGGIGFMTDIRRMNVGLTRAKSSLWILGDSRALKQGEFWAKLINDAKERDRYTRGDVLSLLRKKSERVPRVENGLGDRKSSDTEMKDAPAIAIKAEMKDAPAIAIKSEMPSRGLAPPPQSIGGFNAKGENIPQPVRGQGPPQIGDSKKRPLEGDDNQSPAPKRPNHSSASNRPIPTGPKAAIVPPAPTRPKPPPKPVDPSAMEVLGLAPPSRPPPPPANPAQSSRPPAPTAGPSNAPPRGPRPPKKKKDPFIQRKPKRP